MKKPVLVIMAAGMGSRYGGLKQIDPIDPEGHIIMDFSIYDAVRAGFEKVVFIIKRENEADFGNPLEIVWKSRFRWSMYSRILRICQRAMRFLRSGKNPGVPGMR